MPTVKGLRSVSGQSLFHIQGVVTPEPVVHIFPSKKFGLRHLGQSFSIEQARRLAETIIAEAGRIENVTTS